MPEHHFLHTVREYIRRVSLMNNGDKIIVALSSGIDSMVLLQALYLMRNDLKIELAVAHFNHQLRGQESDEDETFARSVASALTLECYVERANTAAISDAKKLSIQETARELRYAFFNKLRTSLGFQSVATAHHADDNAETILFNIIRGAGVHGLSGIPAHRKDISVIRPFLSVTREEIRGFAEEQKIPHREDSSNAHNDYTRNYLRNSLIPEIRSNINPNLPLTLQRTGELFEQLEVYLKDEAAKILVDIIVHRSSKEIIFNLESFDAKPLFLQEHILLHTAREFGNIEVDFGTVKSMLKIVHAETGTSCSLSKDIVFYRNRNHIAFKRIPAIQTYRYHIDLNKNYKFEFFGFQSSISSKAEYTNDKNTEYIDGDTLGKEFILRPWADGDWFIPLGMKDKKKLSDFFIDEKVPLFEKRIIPVLFSDEAVVWICGKRLDDRYKVTPKTKNILKIEYIPQS